MGCRLILYNYESIVNLILDKKTYLGEKGVCRYCGKNNSEVNFKKLAHAIPELLGNKFLFSNDECDECNAYFDKNLENNLANFMGISRTISQIVGKKGIPNQKSMSGDRIEAVNGDLVIIQGHDANTYEQVSDNLARIESTPTTYIPINVYKCLVKIAISALPKCYLKTFRETIRWVRLNSEPHGFDSRLLNLHVTMVPGINPFRKIWLQLYKRKGDKKVYPYIICILAFSNYMCRFILPFNKKDDSLDLTKLEVPIFPLLPIFKLPGQAPGMKFVEHNFDLSGKKSVKAKSYVDMYTEGKITEMDFENIPEEIKSRVKELGLKFECEE